MVDAEHHAARLESKGIVTHVTAKHSQNLSRVFTGALKSGLWVLIDEQFEDAYQLLNNPKHKVTSGMDREKINEIKSSIKPLVHEQINTAIVYGVVLAVIMLIVFLGVSAK